MENPKYSLIMKIKDDNYFSRSDSEAQLMEFLNSAASSAGLVFLRGRRRVGKSSLLKHTQSQNPKKCFYFSGALDEGSAKTLRRFAQSWAAFSGISSLNEVKQSLLNWGFIFDRMCDEIVRSKKSLWIFLDEIQWLATARSGFVGLFKEAWLRFEGIPSLRIVLCGSSNKFFADNVGGEEKILRGVVTRADIHLQPFLPHEVKKYYCSGLTDDQVTFLYFCFGGIPYYLKRFDFKLGFNHGFNSAVFTEKSIFLNEVNEVVSMDFNKKGLNSVKKVFASFKDRFATTQTLHFTGRIAPSTLTELLDKLITYGLIRELQSITENNKSSRRDVFLYYTDFYLNFYFRVLARRAGKIRRNNSSSIFLDVLTSRGNLYIENFTGLAFENYVQYLIENLPRKSSLIRSLDIADDEDLEVSSERCSDLIVINDSLKLLRCIECKWTNSASILKEGVKQLQGIDPNSFGTRNGYSVSKYLVTNHPSSQALTKLGRESGVKIVQAGLEDQVK